MGWNPIEDIKNAAQNVYDGGRQAVGGAVDAVNQVTGGYGSIPFDPAGIFGPNAINPGPGQPPKAPGIDPGLAKLREEQQKYAKDFRAGMPSMIRMMSENLKSQSNQALGQGLKQTRNDYASRGLSYSGLEKGAEARQRGQAASGLAAGISGINADVENAANTLDAQAVETGVGIQQTQQAIQNQIYSQAMARMNANNAITGSALGTGLIAAMLMA